MQADINQWKKEIDEISEKFRSSFGNLTEAELNWKADAQTWSIAQNIDHLMLINKSYYPIIQKALQKKLDLPWFAKLSFVHKSVGRMILMASQPDRKKKLSTMPVWMPATGNLSADIVEQFVKHQDEFKQVMEGCRSLLMNNTLIHSPANNSIVYKLSDAFEIIIAHEKRHYEQANESMLLMRQNNFSN